GWSISGVNTLVVNALGALMVYGSGGGRFFRAASGGAFLSPPGDFGTLVRNGDGTYTDTDKDRTAYKYDSSGNAISVTDPQGLSRTFQYSGGNLTGLTEPDGSVTTFQFSGGLLSSVQVPGPRTYSFGHGPGGDVTSVTYPDGSTRTFTYDG